VTVDFAALRRAMVEGQVRTYDVTDAKLLAAMETVPRERFVPVARQAVAYVDQPVAVSANRSLLTPMVLARMIQALDIAVSDHILDVAGGTGYSAAVLAQLGGKVVAVEPDESGADMARNCAGLPDSARIAVVSAPFEKAAADHGPFDAVLVNGALELEPTALFQHLKEGGRLVVVMGAGRSGRVMRYTKSQGHVSGMAVLDASAPLLEAFRKSEQFTL
jgi:protein-L-isoaspartate(D-aspartate) O-methyltransferase